jgi:hypothetical protein
MMVGVVMVGTPAGAHVADWAHNWNKHIRPKADKRYVKKSAVKTLQGTYALGLVAASTGDDGWDSISFGFQLATAPQEHFIQSGTPAPAACPGSAAHPLAAAGHLCVYESSSLNRAAVTIFANTATDMATRWGAGLWLQPAFAGNAYSYGTWAVTAPAGTGPARVAPSAPVGPPPGE